MQAPIDIKQQISRRLAQERIRLGFSTAVAFATALSFSQSAISKLERGDALPGGEFLAGCAKLGADVEYILTGQRSAKLDLLQLATAAHALAESRHPLAGAPKLWSDMPEQHAPIAAAVILRMALPLYQAQTGITLAEYCRTVIRQAHPAGIKARAAELFEAAK